jgi:hypothetical protein
LRLTREAASFAVTQELTNILWNLKAHYHVYKSPEPVPILSQIGPVHTIPSYNLRSILILSIHLHLGLPTGSFLLAFPTISYMHSFSRPFVLHTLPISSSLTWLRSSIQRIRSGPRLSVIIRNKFIFYDEKLLAPRLTPKLEDHPLSAVRDCLFNIFSATLYTLRASAPSAT